MKVAIQTYKNTGHSGRGIGVYGASLVEAIRKVGDDIEVVEFGNLSELKNQKLDLIHFLHFDLFQKTLPNNLKIPFIVTVHDLTPLVFSQHYPSGIKGKFNLFWQKKALKKASAVITISNASKKDIVKYLGIDEKKIRVIYSGVGEQFKKITDKKLLQSVKEKYKLPETFAFYSGNVNWNKNILGMAQACIEADIDLVIVGKSFEKRENLNHPEMKSYKQFLEKYADHPKIYILGFVEDPEMVAILNQSTVALFVSFYEGFGFPILEAQKCEVPVITSNISSMPEVGGEGALFVDPLKVEEIRKAIKSIKDDKKTANDLVKKGLKNCEQFSWEKCAKETIEVYEKVL